MLLLPNYAVDHNDSVLPCTQPNCKGGGGEITSSDNVDESGDICWGNKVESVLIVVKEVIEVTLVEVTKFRYF